jgi:nitrite reductase (cytochrome c-552)
MADTPPRSIARIVIYTAIAAALAAAAITALLVTIVERKQEAQNPFYRVVDLTEDTEDPAVWGKNFPLQYDGYRRTVDQQRTRYGGSEAVPRTPSDADPRSIVAQSRLEEDPRLKTMWAGYAFATDFREERGHAYMLDDQTFTERQTMQLRVTRPGFLEGIRAVKAAQGTPNYDPNTMASRQEMRAFVCGQCHVEYYFKGPEKRLTYPWDKGLKADEILSYYQENQFRDWVHAETGAPTLKAQHPEFEMWNQGVHGRSGVTCPDCHMPYQREGAMKVSDHHVRSPLLNVNRACQTCHRWSEDELVTRVHMIQDRTFQIRNLAMDALVALISDLKAARDGGVPDAQLAVARDEQRQAQFLLDFIEAENSMGFHASQESMRILALSIDHTRKGQVALRTALVKSQ